MRRVLIIGSGGAGKTTFARRLSQQTGLPLVHLDSHYWQPGWKPRSPAEWNALVAQLISDETWIQDGNYGGTLPQRLNRADAVILLDLSRIRCCGRVLGRWWKYRGKPRAELPRGCPEQISWAFLGWIWTYPEKGRRRALAAIAASPSRPRLIRLRTPDAVEAFLTQSRAEGENAPVAD